MRVNENILISSLTTMRIGGPAKFVLEAESAQDVADAYGFAAVYKLPVFPLGYGANTIGHDEGYNGVILINRMQGIHEEVMVNGGVRLVVMGGEYWDNVVAYACERGLTGIEALSKIPGLTASAPIQNIGAYGQQVADVIESIEVYDTYTRKMKTLEKEDLQFAYRKSMLNASEKGRYFVIALTMVLYPGEMERPFYASVEKYIADRDLTDFSPQAMREIVSAIRAEKLPDPMEKASAGSFFKNIYLTDEEAEVAENKGYPVRRGHDGNKLNAAWMIERAGFKGKLLHGMRVSKKAPLVLINESAKGYEDLARARKEIVGHVYDKFGFWLEQEPVEIMSSSVVPEVQTSGVGGGRGAVGAARGSRGPVSRGAFSTPDGAIYSA